MAHLKQENLITEKQHGFLKGKSTSSAIISLVEHVIDQIDKEQYVSALFLDYSKAFDCLGHDIISKKLTSLGIRDTANKWKKPSYIGRKLRNLLPQAVKNLKGAALKRCLHNFLVDHPIYTIEEFTEVNKEDWRL
ncbi:uncharacterized protein LOC124366900 [Homalodisca vitripennis]|uniref:uncharacterized protein LOC124366900 n=1 Tax=Homalodisca vitripennis TaxID=197043 RepID=UPI001EEA0580|nr:uncharacterized protein LOC124366900 [Homalodisca vitripennis]